MQDKLIYCIQNLKFVPEELIIELEKYLVESRNRIARQVKRNQET